MNRTSTSSSPPTAVAAPIGPAPVATPPLEDVARIVALARDSEVIYAYWDLPAEALATARARLGHGALSSRLVLRAHDAAEVVGMREPAAAVLEFDVSDADRDAFVRVAKAGTGQIIEIGLSGDDGSFVSIARSGRVELPRAVPATWEPPAPSEVRWMTASTSPITPAPVAPSLPEPARLSFGPSPAPSDRQLAPVVPPQAATAPPPFMAISGTSPLTGWGRPGPAGPGASEAWLTEPWNPAARPAGTAMTVPRASGLEPESHIRSAVPVPLDTAQRDAAGTLDPSRATHALAATPPHMTDPGRSAATLEPPSASVDVEDERPSAAEGVWSSAEVSERQPAHAPGTSLEKRLLPVSVQQPSTALTVPQASSPPGWDQIAGGLGALTRGIMQVTGGALRVAGGLAKLGAWTVQKAIEALRKPKP